MEDTYHEVKSYSTPEPVHPGFDVIRDETYPSFLDLPQHIVDDIILRLRQMIYYDGYLCDLRLVSKQFNETILHCLAFRVKPRYFNPSHYMSCPQLDCHIPRCHKHAACNTTYARIMLQGSIVSKCGQDHPFSNHYRTLSQALAIFQTKVSTSTSDLEADTSYLHSRAIGPCGSLNPTFTNVHSIVVCDAVVMFFKIKRRSWFELDSPSEEVYRRDATFWLKVLACYLGDIELLSRYSAKEDTELSEDAATQSEDLLAMAAACGHEALLGYMIARTPLQRVDFAFALYGACHSGSVRISSIILNIIPAEQVPALCFRSLGWLHGSQRLPLGGCTVVEQIVNGCNVTLRRDQAQAILVALAHSGAAQSLRSVVSRFQDYVLWPQNHRLPLASYSPLWSACVNGDLQCVQSLLEGGYLKSSHPFHHNQLLLGCVDAAVRSNSLSICQKLYQRLGRGVEDMDLMSLSAMDGSIDTMTKKLASNPNLLQNSGESALKSAAERLRVENVEFLLQRGVRSKTSELWAHFEIEWRYRRAHEQNYQSIQKLLKRYDVSPLQVSL